jgi:hypothetical protein
LPVDTGTSEAFSIGPVNGVHRKAFFDEEKRAFAIWADTPWPLVTAAAWVVPTARAPSIVLWNEIFAVGENE